MPRRCGATSSYSDHSSRYALDMFSLTSLKALKTVTCPEITHCKRDPCLYSHEPPKPQQQRLASSTGSSVASTSASAQQPNVANKRPLPPLDELNPRNKVQRPNPTAGSSSSSFDVASLLKLQTSGVGSHTPREARWVSLVFSHT